jgi:RNA polymerase sigma factor (sigma-70 family)
VVRDSFEAENLAQETFLQVYKSLPQYGFKGFKTWISRIALHKAIDFQRSAARKITLASIPLAEVEEIAEEGLSVQDRLLQQEEREMLAACLSKIPEKYEKVLRKSYHEEKSNKQIAVEENISLRTVETRLYRGRKMLRERYEEWSKT